ncbi:MAG: phosphoribosylanthranilate isomerase [Oscillospiraceae bacterium]|nr:phosphoribosylanthranilate isomerase [Oscillospiraceae bacterium]
MTKIKICGLTRVEDIDCVNELHPDYIGFVFVEKSRRAITPEKARELRKRLRPGIVAVGVFVDEPAENIIDMVENDIIDMIQLHGSSEFENAEYICGLAKTGVPIIKAINLQTDELPTGSDFLLFDGVEPGSGRTFDWNSLPKRINQPFFLAGGISPDNVKDAIEKVNPFAVDVSSGVETNGVKDCQKIKALISAVRESGD